MLNKNTVSNLSCELKEIDNKVKTYNTRANKYTEDALDEADKYAKMHAKRMTHDEVFSSVRKN